MSSEVGVRQTVIDQVLASLRLSGDESPEEVGYQIALWRLSLRERQAVFDALDYSLRERGKAEEASWEY